MLSQPDGDDKERRHTYKSFAKLEVGDVSKRQFRVIVFKENVRFSLVLGRAVMTFLVLQQEFLSLTLTLAGYLEVTG